MTAYVTACRNCPFRAIYPLYCSGFYSFPTCWSLCLCLLYYCTQLLQFGGVTLSYMRQQLEEGCAEHSLACCTLPQFAVDDTAGVDNLIMKCKVRQSTLCWYSGGMEAAEVPVVGPCT